MGLINKIECGIGLGGIAFGSYMIYSPEFSNKVVSSIPYLSSYMPEGNIYGVDYQIITTTAFAFSSIASGLISLKNL